MALRCPTCKYPNFADSKVCRRCGETLPNQCPSCGTVLKTAASFCTVCGEIFENDENQSNNSVEEYKKPLIKAKGRASEYVGPKPRDLMSCPKCGRTIAQAVSFCTYCGIKNPASVEAEIAEKRREEAVKAKLSLPRPAGKQKDVPKAPRLHPKKAPLKPSLVDKKPQLIISVPDSKKERPSGEALDTSKQVKPQRPIPTPTPKAPSPEERPRIPKVEAQVEMKEDLKTDFEGEIDIVKPLTEKEIEQEKHGVSPEELEEAERLRASRIEIKEVNRGTVKVIPPLDIPNYIEREHKSRRPNYPEDNFDVNTIKIPEEMVLVPGGEFLFGQEKFEMKLPSFLIDEKPVTKKDYYEFCKATKYPKPWDWAHGSYIPGSGNRPVSFVNINDARAYATWAGKRLPTEIEWEKAAGGTDGRIYPWGNKFEEGRCHCKLNGDQKKIATPASGFPDGKSPYGCLDMVGNVSEWTELFVLGKDDSVPVLRGGSRADICSLTTCRTRFFIADANYISPLIGFRCAKDVDTSS